MMMTMIMMMMMIIIIIIFWPRCAQFPGNEKNYDMQYKCNTNITIIIVIIITARCYASAVLAMGLCPSVCHKPLFY